ncbi:MAG TPA: hypothetical protein VFI91_05870 [Longimicrobiaceae bacterium]|nr:hypothetical protein [Longimicrobiaceae bacterium]
MLKTKAGLPLIAALLVTSPLTAQVADPSTAADSVATLELPDEVADAVIDFFNDPRRIHYSGPTTIPRGEVIQGDVAALGGPFRLAGRIEGSIVVVNGTVELDSAAVVTGGILVVGGGVTGLENARVGGQVLVYPAPLEYREEEGRLIDISWNSSEDEVRIPGWGRSDFLITTGNSYNRVEGLPITFGPLIETAGSNPLRVRALAIYRTESGLTLDTEEMGYFVRAEQFLGGHRNLRIGATAHSLVDPIEDWHISDLESGLSTFFFHRDFRDHYEREGASLFLDLDPPGQPYSLRLETRWEQHESLASGSPWSLFNNSEPWRPQPLVAEGDIGTIAVRANYDTRSDADNPSTGWYMEGRVERSVYSNLTRPEAYGFTPSDFGPLASIAVPAQEYDGFTTAMVDLRRYNRVDPTSRLNFRFVAGGSIDGNRLPPQRQHALGGEGSLPGYSFFRADCGAREQTVYRESGLLENRPLALASASAYFPNYGCDAFALFQAEYRGKLSLGFRWDSAPWRDDPEDEGESLAFDWDISPVWAVFIDAGRGWSYDGGPDSDLIADAGVGILLDKFGVYLATPVSSGGELNLFVRIGPRF